MEVDKSNCMLCGDTLDDWNNTGAQIELTEEEHAD